MAELFSQPEIWLPFVFAGLMGVAILIYVILDGYDLGVGILFGASEPHEKDIMIASIGPFWDANETWLVLAVGLLLIAFPIANGMVLGALYIPVALMLLGLILRGVAFEFRAKVPGLYKDMWNQSFFVGSLLTSLCQGYMLGLYIMGLNYNVGTILFACLTAMCLTLGYTFIGAAWLWTASGFDEVSFAVATNPGSRPGPLAKVASGGELSRLMLALKVVLADKMAIPTMIFDEIDTGTGGAVADAMGERLRKLSKEIQILAITHSPQVATHGHHHLHVFKEIEGGSTRTDVVTLENKARIEEVARMLSGANITDEARAQAQKLLG